MMVSGRRELLAASCVIVALGIVYAFAVPLGLPYDEPAHWQNVLHIARAGTLPHVGDAGVTYEAVQAPLSYLIDAAVAAPLDAVGVDESTNLYVVRLLNVGWLVALLWALVALCRRLTPRAGELTAVIAGTTVAGSPILVAVGASVQNDLPALVLGVLALITFIDGWDDTGWRRHALTGLLLGLAFLAKATVWPLGVVLVLTLACRRRPKQLLALVVAGAAVSGWWVLRNLALYDSLTGNNAVESQGYDFPPVGFHAPGTLVDLVRSAVTFLWIPVEYWRNTISAPGWVEAVVVVATLGLVGAAMRAAGRPTGVQLVTLVVAVAAVLVWAVTTVWIQNASFRLAYLALPAWAWLVATAVSRLRPLAWLLVGGVTVLHVFALTAVR